MVREGGNFGMHRMINELFTELYEHSTRMYNRFGVVGMACGAL